MMTPAKFATEALSQLERDPDEVLVGMAAPVQEQGEICDRSFGQQRSVGA
jgi:hypothetical protein